MTWLAAYDALHALMQEQYAFGDWKSIDWNALNNTIRPKIILAENAANPNDYATALLEYTRSIPDGHVMWGDEMEKIIYPNIEESYGFGIAELDNGKVIATTVTALGPAASEGMLEGDEILEWNNVAITTAASQSSILWRPETASIATTELKRYEQFRALTLDPDANVSRVKFSRPDGSGVTTKDLTATDDGNTILQKTQFWNKINPADPIQHSILPSGYGYIVVGTLDTDNFSFDKLFNDFKEAMEFMATNNVPGLIIDLRGNGGGEDELAAKISGFFYAEETFYEYQNQYNAYNGLMEIILPNRDGTAIIGWGIPLNIPPQTPLFTGPVVALVNPDTTSSAEGVAMTIQNLENGYVVGIFGTNGSFGMTGGEAKMPMGYIVKFPNGQSLNQDREIQLDSRNGIGGITPDIKVSRTSANMINYVGRTADIELNRAVSFLQSL
ncbi:S41 family peptidase [Maridesulfovibrio salexigens]|nr:S41 family peptidase [Maridesulfovibrio salexigens]